jgi:hypothetical protein
MSQPDRTDSERAAQGARSSARADLPREHGLPPHRGRLKSLPIAQWVRE